MKKKIITVLLGSMLGTYIQVANATVYLREWTYNIDGVVSDSYFNDPNPVNGSIDLNAGLSSLSSTQTYTFTGSGAHSFTGFYDFDIDSNYNDELGSSTGTLATGQSWEIGDSFASNIYYDAVDGALTNANSSSGQSDIAFAQGWNFNLNAGQTATISLNLSTALPTNAPGFYLTQYQDPTSTDPNPSSIYYWMTLAINGPSNNVPEPGSLALMGAGLLGLAFIRKKRTQPSLFS